MKLFFSAIASVFFSVCVFAQQPVTGVVRDAASSEPLIGAIVLVDNGKYHAVADLDGNYKVDLPDGTYKFKVSYTGYNADSAIIVVAGKPVVHDFACNNSTLKEVEIIADVAIDRKTPVAFSNVNELKIREELGSRDMTMLLNSTPGAYASEQGGGAGDSRVNIRGVDQRNIGVMVDGVPMNDMENGQVYWSNWDGLSDVTRTMQVQRGLGASKLAIPSVGGTINILTKGIDNKKSLVVRTDFGSNSMQKLSFMYNSGEFGKGWGITFAGSRRTGNGWADETWDDQWAYFFKVQKRFEKHLLTFSVNGAPQKHAQRYNRLPVGIYDRGYANSLGVNTDSLYAANNTYTTPTQGPRGRRYNPDWGYLAYGDGQTGIISRDVNFFHKPLFNLSWSYAASEKLVITSVAYLSLGYGGGTNYSGSVTRDTLTGQENATTVYNSNHTTIDPIYSADEHKSTRVLYAAMNNHIWLGNITTATYKPTKDLSFLFGIDARHYKGSHFRQVYDLLGGDYFVDASNQNQPRGTYPGDPNFQYYKKVEGDKITYWNDSYVDWEGLFAQAEYAVNDKWSAFITGSYSGTQYERVDHFRKRDIVIGDSIIPMIVGYNETYYTNGSQSAVAQNGAIITTSGDTTIIDNPSGPTYYIPNATGYSWDSENARTARTNKRSFTGYTVKTGVNYNISSHYNVFVNLGYLKMAPRFNTVFDNNNKEYPTTKYQYVKAIEMGFGARYSYFAANLNLYYTSWQNKPPSFTPSITTPDGTFYYDLLGLDTYLKGVELDFNWKLAKNLQVEGLASVGDWKINSFSTVNLYDNSTYLLVDTINYSAKNIHVGDAAQTQFGGSIRYEPFKGLYIKPRFTYFGNHYANFDPITLAQVVDFNGNPVSDNRDRESWKMPSYSLLDLFAGYELREQLAGDKNKVIVVSFNLSVTNVLDTKYISDGQNGNDFGPSTAIVFMGLGRRWNAGMRFAF
jgi:hypothetical protein